MESWVEGGGRRRLRATDCDNRDVAMELEGEHEGVELIGDGDGGKAETGEGGVLKVGAGVGEEDEGHCWWFGVLGRGGDERGRWVRDKASENEVLRELHPSNG